MDALRNSPKMNPQSYSSLYKQSKELLAEKIHAIKTLILSPESSKEIWEEKITAEAQKRVACFLGAAKLTSEERLGKIEEAEAQLLSRENNTEIEKGWSPMIFERLSLIFPGILGEQLRQSQQKALTLWRKLLQEKELSASQDAINHQNSTHIPNNNNFFHSLAHTTTENIARDIALLEQQIAAQRKLIEGGREKAFAFIQSLSNQIRTISDQELTEIQYWLKKAGKQPEEAIQTRLKELLSLAFTFHPQNQLLFSQIWADKNHDTLLNFFDDIDQINAGLLSYEIDPNSISNSLGYFYILLNRVKIQWDMWNQGDNQLLKIAADAGKTWLGEKIIKDFAPIVPKIPMNTLEIRPICEKITTLMAELQIPLTVEMGENEIENDGALAEVIGNASASEEQSSSDAAIAQIIQDEESIEAPLPHDDEIDDNIISDAGLAQRLQIEENQAMPMPAQIISRPSSSPQDLSSPIPPIQQARQLPPAAIAITPPERPVAPPNASAARISRGQRIWRQVLAFFARPLQWLSNAWNWFKSLFSSPRSP